MTSGVIRDACRCGTSHSYIAIKTDAEAVSSVLIKKPRNLGAMGAIPLSLSSGVGGGV